MLAHYITEGVLCVPRVIASHHLLLNPLGLLHSVRAACRDLLLLPVQGSLHAGPHGLLLLGVGRGGLAAWRHVSQTSGGGGAAATGSSGGGRGDGGVHGRMGLAVGHHRIIGSSGHSESGAGNEVRWQHGAAAAQHMTGSTRARSTGSAAEADGAGVEGAGALLVAEGREAGAATFTGEAGSGRGMGGSTTS
ncbi:unnamed protein product [Closterium sp. NIES-64]|nr:unnamed protein product [Closterium sp. NIES-64]